MSIRRSVRKRNNNPRQSANQIKTIIIKNSLINEIPINYDGICNLSLEHFLHSNQDLKNCLEYNANTRHSLLNRAQGENNRELVERLMIQRKKFSIIYFPYI
ncbi:MAG: hypothetical protein VXX80_10650, partial [Bacteroidota bacterium]|nr:hypothetical protein [Bacteroidota bacterium]